jgi:hypothetical protein
MIIPMVLYHGQKKWSYGTEFSVLFPKLDVTQYSDDEITGMALSRVVMLLFKHIFDPDHAGDNGIRRVTRVS